MQRIVAAVLLILLALAPARATVNSAASTVTVPGNGSQVAFTFPFIGVAATDIVVIYTTSAGVQTTLVQGPGPTQYTVTLNAAVPPSLWGIGGSVSYNPSGTPIPAGSTLTITRTLPFTQATSLQNQTSFGQYLSSTEQALDTLDMQIQQLNTSSGYAVQMNPANSRAPIALPPAAQAGGMGLCFSSTGLDLIACSLAPSGVISSAMAPVVGASTLALGRTAFGLGTMATENINAGTCGGPSIQDDGSGNARVVLTTAPDSTNQSVTCNFHLTYHVATGPLTYTLGRASTTYFNGFSFTISSAVGVTTVSPNASDSFSGVASGSSIAVPQGASCTFTTNAASSGTWYKTCSSTQPSLAASVGANALTLTLYAPSISFRDTTLANGDALGATPVAGLSITIPSGATLGTLSSNVPFRIWIFAAYNGGTPVLGVATCSATNAIYACAAWETLRKSGTAITSGSTALGALYTASAVTNDAVRIIGYADFGSGLSTAGAWASTPTTLQICVPPFVCKRPGDLIQMVQSASQSVSISPTTSPNLVKFSTFLNISAISTSGAAIAFKRASTTIFNVGLGAASSISQMIAPGVIYDAPGTTSPTAYSTSITTSGTPGNVVSIVEEIMGALEPANDNTELRMVG